LVSRAAAGAIAVAALLVVSGCGSDDPGAGSATHGVGTPATATGTGLLPPTTSTPAAAATATATTPATTPTSPEDQEGGAGDEQAAVVPATFTFAAGGVRPARVEVPPFFTIRLSGVSDDGRAHRIGFQGRTIAVPSGTTRSATFTGLKAGTYPVDVDGAAGAAQIVVTADAAGP
jgi:hypothetical protein